MKPALKVSLLLAAGIATSQVFAAPAQTGLPDSCAKDAKGNYSQEFDIPCKALDNFLTTFNAKETPNKS
ncbi:hypothetical protein, partial [Pseudomonas juntendi]